MHLRDVERQYDRVSGYYDAFSTLVLGGLLRAEKYRLRAIELLGDIEGATVLDVGCGTGRNFQFLTTRVGADGLVVGLDYSHGMLRVARRRVKQCNWRNVQLVRGDATTLNGIGSPVDALVSVWCYGVVEDLARALRRAVGVVRPGGSIVIMVFVKSRPDRGPLRHLYPMFDYAIRRSGIDSCGDADHATLVAKWRRGRALLRSRLDDYREETFLQGTGAIISGRAPPPTRTHPAVDGCAHAGLAGHASGAARLSG